MQREFSIDGRSLEMERLLIEIRAAEGGADAKLLVSDQFAIYAKAAARDHL